MDCSQDMKMCLQRKSFLTAKQLKALLPALQNISVRIAQGLCLRKLNMPSRKMSVKPLLPQAMKDGAFVRVTENWIVEDWKKALFSDKSHSKLTFRNKSSRCRRPIGLDRLNPMFTKKSVKHLPQLMAWGCFSRKGRV
jgi:hypothetical protein